jgi:hypothetical protein
MSSLFKHSLVYYTHMRLHTISQFQRLLAMFMNSGSGVFFSCLIFVTLVRNTFHFSKIGEKFWFSGNFNDIRDWPGSFGLGFTEHYIPILVHKLVTNYLDSNEFIIWQISSLLSIIISWILMYAFINNSSDSKIYNRTWLLIFFSSSGMMAIMHNLGRYDTWFFLGCVLWVTSKGKMSTTLGAFIMTGSHWQFSIIVLLGVYTFKRFVKVRNKEETPKSLILFLLIATNLTFFQVFKYNRSEVYNGVSPRTRELFNNFLQGGFLDNLVKNFIIAFPNQIYSILGTLWIGLVLIYYFRDQKNLRITFILPILFPVIAWLTMGPDGTRDVAITATAIVLYLFKYAPPIKRKIQEKIDEEKLFAIALMATLFLPSINIFHGDVLVNNLWIYEIWESLKLFLV